jgi:hypothetical protein
MSDFSLMPKHESKVGNLPVSMATIKVLAGFVAVVVALFIAGQYLGGKESAAKSDLDNAKAEQQQVQMKTAKVKTQLSSIQASGGSGRRNLAKGLMDARMDWKPLILVLIRSAAPGTYYTGGFSGSAPVSTGSGGSSDSTPFTLPLSGTSPSRADLEKLVRTLRKKKINGHLAFLSVQLNSITTKNADPSATGATGAAGAVTTPVTSVDWSLTLTLPKPPAMPSAGGASASSSSSGGN